MCHATLRQRYDLDHRFLNHKVSVTPPNLQTKSEGGSAPQVSLCPGANITNLRLLNSSTGTRTAAIALIE